MSNFQEWCVKVLPLIQVASSGEAIQVKPKECDDNGWGYVDSYPMCFPVTAFDFENYDYRIKPRTIMIGDIEVPEPMREAPESGSEYFLICLIGENVVSRYVYSGMECEFNWIKRGLCHTEKEAAMTHAKALIALTAKKDASHE